MKSKKIVILVVLLCLTVGIISAALLIPSGSEMKEIRSEDTSAYVSSMRAPFSLQQILFGPDNAVNAYTFKGIVKSVKQYEVSWTDDNGEKCGPYNKAIIEVKVNKDYYGKASAADTLKILCPFSIGQNPENPVVIKEGAEYVFTNCWGIDDKYYSYAESKAESASWKNDPSLKKADLIIGSPWCSMIPVENSKAYLYHGFFDGNEFVASKILTAKDEQCSVITSSDCLSGGDFIALDFDVFEGEFCKLFG